MLGTRETSHICSPSQHCSQWAWTYLKYCLCNAKDGFALTLGLVSVLSWGVAEVPQIITNYREKSAEGLSVLFLMTWIVGDLFNLTGCWLEPATLPTQFYMALLYTVTSPVLISQTVYYSHIYPQLKANKKSLLHKEDGSEKENLLYKIDEREDIATGDHGNGSNLVNEGFHVPSSPILVSSPATHHHGSAGRDLYYMSARSLSSSPVPMAGILLGNSRDSGRSSYILARDQRLSREPLLIPRHSAPHLSTKNMLCVVSSSFFLLCTYHFHLSANPSLRDSPHGMVIMVGRKLLQSKAVDSSVSHGGGGTEIASILGWAMAAIYMGGRLPQIWLNIRRGNFEGLNPMMFMFALMGNATYVGSILVNSMDWSTIRPNMPWLVDAAGCVLLDAFILIQFVYFHYWKNEDAEKRYVS
ncbi:uncharacterized protein A4U43_UnF10800 [Asparagus officinalis]|uniref:PQ-loop repeat family protein / transmembrane family protein n=1 Tax=Asparagus officinalis TaxID=4686 RepID=A0A1R3L5F2_ASPOF|nr:probable vacuolar amino acid transporter YPQ1 [Asparagus officinalis]XP_020250787.1 probable vacuolar amino acid transporter YPQ1 [Asparagus officinalis]ONK54838.1 uncharacterized protein A4U43_UnF10800 [Asparagus officinalis]